MSRPRPKTIDRILGWDMPAKAKFALLVLSICGEPHRCEFKYAALARCCSCSEASIKRRLGWLAFNGYLTLWHVKDDVFTAELHLTRKTYGEVRRLKEAAEAEFQRAMKAIESLGSDRKEQR